MAKSPVLRFPISGQDDGSFLVEVSSNGSQPLDLKLVGSESTAVFMVKLRHRRIAACKASGGHCTDQEWQQILTSSLVEQQPLRDIEIKANVESDGSCVTLSFRKNIQGITQRLGSIKLEENDKTEISPFDWCVAALASKDKVTEDLATATAKVESLEKSINELKGHLDELIKAKDDDETQLLEKFRDLINEKKVKIRQQQRLLASASVDPDKLAKVGASQGSLNRPAGKSRASKRKAVKDEADSSDDDGFEKMDVDNGDANNAGQESEQGDGQLATTEDDTPSEADSEAEPAPPAVKSQKMDAAPPSRNTRCSQARKSPSLAGSDGSSDAPPPRRNLPFMQGKKKAAPPPAPADDEETASDDDEL
ncbi:Uu.00g067830.m01.CDS01 [Anthostomella pinea]|uniref:Uu.00g067830.m01.CDS01 n=1 Tax=Anthostomella pinea TaxID=933095 RepID=A0AAI8VVF1_9PEZI|nr:Uu.00g067830.m01.CDS01 [Anthostomella pinea]